VGASQSRVDILHVVCHWTTQERALESGSKSAFARRKIGRAFTQGGKGLCTLQLHSAVCQLVEYVELLGAAAFQAEFWV
jgi:hypothetical protein